MVVGQQTRGWRRELNLGSAESPVGELMDGYERYA